VKFALWVARCLTLTGSAEHECGARSGPWAYAKRSSSRQSDCHGIRIFQTITTPIRKPTRGAQYGPAGANTLISKDYLKVPTRMGKCSRSTLGTASIHTCTTDRHTGARKSMCHWPGRRPPRTLPRNFQLSSNILGSPLRKHDEPLQPSYTDPWRTPPPL